MTLSVGGGNFNPTPQPIIYQDQTSGRNELAKHGELGLGSTVIAPHTDLVPFQNMQNRNLWNYKSESGRPTLPPPGSFRMLGANLKESESWGGIFNELMSQLPQDAQDKIEEARDQDYVVLKEVLEGTARRLEALDIATAKMGTSEAQLRAAHTKDFATQLYGHMIQEGKATVASAKKALDLMTPNDPDYLASQDLIGNLENAVSQFKMPRGGVR